MTIARRPNWTTQGVSAYDWVYVHQGGRFDGVVGLYHFRHREYSPELGRFPQRDPIEFEAGDPNLYRFVLNSPTNYTDPSGQAFFIPFIIVGALAGAYLLGPGAGTAQAPGSPAEHGLIPPRRPADDFGGALVGFVAFGSVAAGSECLLLLLERLISQGGAPPPGNPPPPPSGLPTPGSLHEALQMRDTFRQIAEVAARRQDIQAWEFAIDGIQYWAGQVIIRGGR